MVDDRDREKTKPQRLKEGRNDALSCDSSSVNNCSIDADSHEMQSADDAGEHQLLQNQQSGNQDESDKNGGIGNSQIQENAEREKQEQGKSWNSNCALRLMNVKQAATSAIGAVPLQKQC